MVISTCLTGSGDTAIILLNALNFAIIWMDNYGWITMDG
jgi:hypothetical protein